MTKAANDWGTVRAEAVRERNETLDAVEVDYLAALLEQQPNAGQFAELVGKLRRIEERAAERH